MDGKLIKETLAKNYFPPLEKQVKKNANDSTN